MWQDKTTARGGRERAGSSSSSGGGGAAMRNGSSGATSTATTARLSKLRLRRRMHVISGGDAVKQAVPQLVNPAACNSTVGKVDERDERGREHAEFCGLATLTYVVREVAASNSKMRV